MADLYLAEALIPERFLRPEETVVVSSNERKLLQLIWRHPGISRSEITGHADLTQQSVHRILDQLSERGIVQLGEAKPGAGRGQPSPMLRLNGSHAYACGISVNTDISFNYGFGGGVITDGELMHGGNGNAGEFSGMFDSEETKRRPALQYLIDRLNRNGVNVPSIHYMRRHFDCDWPGVAEWLDDVTPAYNRLVNALRAVVDPQAIVFGGQIPPDLAQMLAERTRIFDRPRYGIHRPHPKLIVSEIATDASAMGAAIIPFRRTFY